MNRFIRIALTLAALALAGCAHLGPFGGVGDASRAEVFVVDGFVVLNQEPVIVRRSKGEDAATWQLPVGSTARFDGTGITVDAFVKPLPRTADPARARSTSTAPTRDTSQVGLIRCRSNEARTEATCTVPKEVRAGFYAYTVRLTQDGKPLELDPTLMLD
jgi:hypothetical protein